MNARSKIEVSNYAFMTNQYLANHRGKKVKVKSTKRGTDAQRSYCATVKSSNKALFQELNAGKTPKDKLFSVVGHVPDQALSGTQAQQANVTAKGMYQSPGWLPMTRSANGLVAQLAGKTGEEVWEIRVDGAKPECLLQPNQY